MNDKTLEKSEVETRKPEELSHIETPKTEYKEKLAKFIKPALKILLLVVLPIVLLLAIIYYFFVFLSAKGILARSYKNLREVTSLKYSLEVNVNFSNPNYGILKEIGPESNLLKIIHPASYKATGEGMVDFDNNYLEGDSNFRISSGGNDIAKLYLKNNKDEYFLKLSEFSYSNYIDKSLLDTWIRADNKFLEDKFGIKLISEPESSSREEVLNNIKEFPPIEPIDKFPSDKVRGEDAYHFKFKLDSDNLVKDFSLGGNSVVTKISFKDGDIWIGKKKNSVFRINIAGEVGGVGAEGTTLELNFDVTFYDFNTKNKIEFPESFVDVRKFLQ
jgi:hypothetical protein